MDCATRAKKTQMNKDRIAGSAKQAKGVIKEATGKVLGDDRLTAEGERDQIVGKIENTIGQVKDALKK